MKCTINNIYCHICMSAQRQHVCSKAKQLQILCFRLQIRFETCVCQGAWTCPPSAHPLCTFGLLLTRILRTIFTPKMFQSHHITAAVIQHKDGGNALLYVCEQNQPSTAYNGHCRYYRSLSLLQTRLISPCTFDKNFNI